MHICIAFIGIKNARNGPWHLLYVNRRGQRRMFQTNKQDHRLATCLINNNLIFFL